jgi:hypothetical protein
MSYAVYMDIVALQLGSSDVGKLHDMLKEYLESYLEPLPQVFIRHSAMSGSIIYNFAVFGSSA